MHDAFLQTLLITVIKNSYSTWVIAGVPQGSISCPFIFKIFITDLFLFPKMYHIANCGDNNTLYPTGDCFEVVIEKLSADLISFNSWFHERYVLLNPTNVTLFSYGKIPKLFQILICREQQQKSCQPETCTNCNSS